LVAIANSSPVRCWAAAVPIDEKFSLPGFFLAYSTNSWNVLYGLSAAITITSADDAMP
jgi:hypothetical protein